ncbi:MAG: Crp/Fnr family transcriptional regulator [Spirosomataceae bacterium]
MINSTFSHETKYWFLRNHKLFSVLNRDEMQEICLITNFKTAKKGEIIYFSHDDLQRIYTLKKGVIKIVESDDQGNEIIKDVLQAGDLFGQVSFDDQEINEFAVAVSESVTICSFKIDDFEKVITKNPALAIGYTKLVGLRFKRLQNRYANLVFKDVKTRLRLFLKEWATKESNGATQQVVIKNYLTHQDIASLICSTRQTVTQLLNELKMSGLVDYSRSEIIIPDVNKL